MESACLHIGRSHPPRVLSLSSRQCSVIHVAVTTYMDEPSLILPVCNITFVKAHYSEQGGTRSSSYSFQMGCSKDEASRSLIVLRYTTEVRNMVLSSSTPYKFCQPNSTIAKTRKDQNC
jgi:hypothetical protein